MPVTTPWQPAPKVFLLLLLLVTVATLSSAQSVSFTEYAVPTPSSYPRFIAAGPDGALWFTESDGNQIGRITPSGVIKEYPALTSSASPWDITVGSDGALWFTEAGAGKIGRITTAGVITEYPISNASHDDLWGITA
jgi:streptogramin lyase